MLSLLTSLALQIPFAQAPEEITNAKIKQKKPPGSEHLLELLQYTAWISFGICIAAVMFTGAMMGISSRRGEGGEHAGRLGWTLAGAIIIGSASGIVGAFVGS